jgi:hypothetical protein
MVDIVEGLPQGKALDMREAGRWTRVAPTLPAPTTVIFLRMISSRISKPRG